MIAVAAALLGLAVVPVDLERVAASASPPRSSWRRRRRRAAPARTSTTPGTALAAVASNDLTVAPNSGGRCSTATSMSGEGHVDSELRGAVGLCRHVDARQFLADELEVLGVLQRRPWSAPAAPPPCRRARRTSPGDCSARAETTPRSTINLAGGTFHSAAAAATSMARAVAPALRSCIQEFAIARAAAGALYRAESRGCRICWRLLARISTRICAQSASSSSATMVARPV